MSILRQTIPGALRKPMESIRSGSTPQTRTPRAPVQHSSKPTLLTVANSRFARIPQEPEDARITGVTRSLHRRLLALNVGGTLRGLAPMLDTKIA